MRLNTWPVGARVMIHALPGGPRACTAFFTPSTAGFERTLHPASVLSCERHAVLSPQSWLADELECGACSQAVQPQLVAAYAPSGSVCSNCTPSACCYAPPNSCATLLAWENSGAPAPPSELQTGTSNEGGGCPGQPSFPPPDSHSCMGTLSYDCSLTSVCKVAGNRLFGPAKWHAVHPLIECL